MRYQKEYTSQISFPLGGIGSGSIGLDGSGRLVDWEIFNRPAKGSVNGYSHIAIKAKTKQGVRTKILNGDLTEHLTGQYQKSRFKGFGFGPEGATMCGFPHFKNVVFQGEFPIAKLIFEDEDFPAKVTMTAFNPFIPLDADNSSIPAAFFEIETENTGEEETEYQIAFSVMNPFEVSENQSLDCGDYHMLTLKNAGVPQDHISYGDLTLASDHKNIIRQEYWYRGGWQDGIVTFWNDFNREEDMPGRSYDKPGQKDGSTMAARICIRPGQVQKVRFVLSWNVPNNCYNYWTPGQESASWKNYYAVLFEDSVHSASYALKNWTNLYERTVRFKEALFSTTLDETIIEAVSATMSVLKTATVLRLSDGSFYGWEGVHEEAGSCEGTCQHVWNYAYALCFLFPELERSIRDLEFKYSTYENGWMVFRLKLPLGTQKGTHRACLDGQMGAVIKCYREWKISGDDEWLKENWSNITKVLEYAWSDENPDEWDRNKDGVLEGRQHHTLDMELFGPSSWLQSMYLAALKAAAEMAEYLGDFMKAREYKEIFCKGYRWTKENLFNGKYFIQKVDITDKSITEHFHCEDVYWNEEAGEIKYQIGEGSEIDQMLGQWHCIINGLGDVLDPEQVDIALENMMKNNYKASMREFANPWRIFSLNDEAGSIICDYPKGVYKPRIPVPYCEETMHGFEYQFAGLLFAAGRMDDGVKVVKSVRDKYDGRKRNPWNEIECGSNYARSMASFALIPILSGFEFHLPKKYIGFNPVSSRESFQSFFSLGTGWGIFSVKENKVLIKIEEGMLKLEKIGLKFAKKVTNVTIDGIAQEFTFEEGKVCFAESAIRNSVEITYE